METTLNPFPSETRNCKRCDGAGTVFHKGFTTSEGKVYADSTDTCRSCDGRKTFTEPVLSDILGKIKATRGKNKGKLRASMTSYDSDPRAYYVWRWARFHGGVDTTLPMMAGIFASGDPFTAELDLIADSVAKAAFGSDMRGARRWQGLLY